MQCTADQLCQEAYNEAGSLCFLLCHLLSLHSSSVLSAESKVGDGDVVQVDIEILCSLCQYPPDISADHLQCHEQHCQT